MCSKIRRNKSIVLLLSLCMAAGLCLTGCSDQQAEEAEAAPTEEQTAETEEKAGHELSVSTVDSYQEKLGPFYRRRNINNRQACAFFSHPGAAAKQEHQPNPMQGKKTFFHFDTPKNRFPPFFPPQ